MNLVKSCIRIKCQETLSRILETKEKTSCSFERYIINAFNKVVSVVFASLSYKEL